MLTDKILQVVTNGQRGRGLNPSGVVVDVGSYICYMPITTAVVLLRLPSVGVNWVLLLHRPNVSGCALSRADHRHGGHSGGRHAAAAAVRGPGGVLC